MADRAAAQKKSDALVATCLAPGSGPGLSKAEVEQLRPSTTLFHAVDTAYASTRVRGTRR